VVDLFNVMMVDLTIGPRWCNKTKQHDTQ